MAQILLAEDDNSMREFLAKALRRAGYEVVPVGDGLDALAQLSEMPFDLLLADVVMPGLDGIELARRATKKQPGIKVMFITGFAAVVMSARREVDDEHIELAPIGATHQIGRRGLLHRAAHCCGNSSDQQGARPR